MLRQLDEIELKYKGLQATADKYNNWQMVLETQPTVFENLESLREAVDLRCSMWRSLHQWQELTEKWKVTVF